MAPRAPPARRSVWVPGLRQEQSSMLRRGWKSMLEMYLQWLKLIGNCKVQWLDSLIFLCPSLVSKRRWALAAAFALQPVTR